MSDDLKELLPCPFCGKKPYVRSGFDIVACPNQSCPASVLHCHKSTWNTRPAPGKVELDESVLFKSCVDYHKALGAILNDEQKLFLSHFVKYICKEFHAQPSSPSIGNQLQAHKETWVEEIDRLNKKAWGITGKASPHQLYKKAKGDDQEYKRLLIEHGHLVPKTTSYDEFKSPKPECVEELVSVVEDFILWFENRSKCKAETQYELIINGKVVLSKVKESL